MNFGKSKDSTVKFNENIFFLCSNHKKEVMIEYLKYFFDDSAVNFNF